MNQKKDIDTIAVLRSVRVHKIAVFDLVGSVVGCEIVFRWFGAPRYLGAVSSIPISIVVHKALGIKTQLS
jgi:hypothetical protein